MITKEKLLSERSLFSLEAQGVSITEMEQIKVEILNKLFLSNAIFFPGNTPSLKNSKEILQMFTKYSDCCRAPVFRVGKGTAMKAYCTKCKKETKLKRPILAPSKRVREYKKASEGILYQNKPKFIQACANKPLPYLLGFFFVRDSKRKFDFGNAMEVLLDLFTEYGYYDDDNMNIVMNFPLGYQVDPNRPGAYVVVMDTNFLRDLIKHI